MTTKAKATPGGRDPALLMASDVVRGPQSPPAGAGVPATLQNASTALAVPSDLMAKLAAAAKDVAAAERPSISKISLRAGVMSYAGSPVVGNAMNVVALAAVFRNVYYKDRFDPNNIQNPSCFAIGLTDKDIAPHENVAEPQAETCAACHKHEWGSDPNGGRGKACKEGRRLILIPEDALLEPEKLSKSEMAIMDLPVTSVKNWANTVNQIATGSNLPFWAVVLRVEVRPDPKTQFKVLFTHVRDVADPALLAALMARAEVAQQVGLTSYDETALTNSPVAEPREANKKF